MITEHIRLDEKNPDARLIERAGNIIKEGGLVAFPTETVYGLGGDALNAVSSEKIYAAKGRPSDNPLIVHIAELEALSSITPDVPKCAGKLAAAYWPGPLTMIFKKSALVPVETTGGLDTVAVRMPDHRIALDFIRASGGYVAAPSANASGRPSPTTAAHVAEDMDGRIRMIIDGGEACIGLESTIVDVTERVPVILRPGFITREMLKTTLGYPVEVDRAILDKPAENLRPKAPGMKYRHYAPKGNLTIVEGPGERVVEEINRRTEQMLLAGETVGIIAAAETAGSYQNGMVKDIGPLEDEETIARRLYGLLREFDEAGVSIIYSEAFYTPRMGQAIMNRLLKAAGHQIVRLDNGGSAEAQCKAIEQ